MGVVLLVLLLALVLGGAGFVLHTLWIVAAVVLVLWLLGFAMRSPSRVGGGRSSRWYRW